jgi:predicted porin
MKITAFASLSALLAAGCLQAQSVDVQSELARQNARIAALEKKANPKVESATGLSFPEYLTPYVLIDLTLLSKSNVTVDGKSKIDMGEPFFSGNRWGLKGSIKTNVDGLNVIYKLESEYFLYDGEQGKANVLFNRDAWIGISGKLGKLTFGRQNTLARDFAVIYCDPFNHAEVNYDEGGWTNNSNFKSLVYYAGAVSISPVNGGPAGTRQDKGMVWKYAPADGFCYGASYNLNYEATNNTRNSTASVATGFNAPTWHMSAFYTTANNTGATNATVVPFTQTSMSIGGNINLTKALKINAGYFHYTSDQNPGQPTRTDNAYTVSGSYQFSPQWAGFLGYQVIKVDSAALGLNAAGVYTIPNAFAYPSTSGTAAYVNGGKNVAYAAFRNYLRKGIEFYGVFTYMKLTDSFKLSTGVPKDSQTELGLGLRMSL